MKHKRRNLLMAGVATLATFHAVGHAQTFTYAPRDLLIGFRSSAPNDFVVDIGQASLYYGAAPGSSFTITSFSASQLTSVFGGMDGLSFAVLGDVRTAGDVNNPLNTLWLTAARSDVNVQSAPWNRQSSFTQGNTAAKIDGIANGAVSYAGTQPPGPVNTATAISLPDNWNSGGTAYTVGVGSGNFGTFQGSVENTTPAGFASGGVLRSDLYALQPGSGAGTYLGFFELHGNGSMSFTAVPEPGTCTLLGFGLLAAIRRFRRQS